MKHLVAAIDGHLVPLAEAKLSLLDRGVLYGHGVFTTARVQQGRILNWQAHYDRLVSNCLDLNIKPPSLDLEGCHRLIHANKAEEGVWKLKIIITAGSDNGRLSLETAHHPCVTMLLQPFIEQPCTGLSLKTYSTARHPVLSKCKTLAYLENAWLLTEAKKQGADDTLICDTNGTLLETTIAAIFWVHQETLYYPDFSLPLLPSTALTQLLQTEIGLQTCASTTTFPHVPSKAVWFAINALRGVMPIAKIDDTPLAQDAALAKRLQSALGIKPANIV